MNLCIACGMPMKEASDHAEGDMTKTYCKHCARPDGSMQSYDEKCASMAAFIMRTQGLAEGAATQTAQYMMASLPAWQGRKS